MLRYRQFIEIDVSAGDRVSIDRGLATGYFARRHPPLELSFVRRISAPAVNG